MILIATAALAALAIWLWGSLQRTPKVTNFKQCLEAGYPTTESTPAVCRTPAGKNYVDDIPANESPEVKNNLSFDTLVSGDSQGQMSASQSVIRDSATWNKIWNDMHSHISPRPPLLEVNFSKDMVIYIQMGVQTSGGHSTKIQNIALGADQIIVLYSETSPGPNCMVAQALSNPYHIVRLERSDKPVSFELSNRVKDCQR